MFTLKKLTLVALALSFLAVACAPKKNAKQNIRGRLSRGAAAAGNGQVAGIFAQAQFGTVSGYDQNFSYAAQMLAQGILVGTEDQIGNVSPQPLQNKGIFFRGAGLPHYNTGSFNTGHILIEIWDDYAGTIGSDGKPIPPVELYIGPQSQGFQSVTGGSFGGGQIQLTFTSSYETVMLDGYIQGQEFVGTFTFSNSFAQGMQLGQFRVPACGFFRCQ